MSNLAAILKAMELSAQQSGRDPQTIELVAITKGHTWQEIESLYQEGQHVFGESKVTELLPKIQDAPKDCSWHFIGHLQANKVRKVVGQCALIHSVDSEKLAQKISAVSQELALTTSILLEVNVSGEPAKHGFSVAECKEGFARISNLPNLKVEGLMTMAPLTEDEATIRQTFAGLRKLRNELATNEKPLKVLSMGMSHDYKLAIEEGATLLRIGTALFT